MHPLLSSQREPRIVQQPGRVTGRRLESIDQLLLILPERAPASLWRSLPQGARLAAAAKKRAAGKIPSIVSRLHNKRQTLVVGGKLASSATAFERLTIGRKLVLEASDEKPGCLGICVLGFDADTAGAIAQDVLAAVLAAAFYLPRFSQEAAQAGLRSVHILGLDARVETDRVLAEANGNNLARWLTSLPPNKLDAVTLAGVAKSLAADNGWSFKRYDTKALEKIGAGAFLAVAQGNDDDSASIVRLRYRPKAKNARAALSLVGKGIIFDTGGTNLKPFESMLEMHGDMQGSAVALGALLAISQMQLPIAVDCWLAITENRTGPRAYKSQDVVTAANGKTIQTIHTDAEGRMALADALVLAERDEPGVIIDYATLTGACVTAITTRYSGVFTNRPDWHPRLKRTGQRSGERVWPFPADAEFLEPLRSAVADLKQCAIKAPGDHILAASFLREFVNDETPWIHIDLSASNHDGGLAHAPGKVTGFGIRLTTSLVLDENLLETAP